MEYSTPYLNVKRPWDPLDSYRSQPAKRLQLGPESPLESLSEGYVDPLASSTVLSLSQNVWELGAHDLGYSSVPGGTGFNWGTHFEAPLDHAAIDTTVQTCVGTEAFEPTLPLYQEVCFGLARKHIFYRAADISLILSRFRTYRCVSTRISIRIWICTSVRVYKIPSYLQGGH
jgi:hypothetical protein